MGKIQHSLRCAAISALLAFGAIDAASAIGTIEVLALMNGRAILAVDGARRVLADGEVSPEGVRLISASTRGAIVAVDGREFELAPDVVTRPVGVTGTGSDNNRVVLWADSQGFFRADGRVNGRAVNFLVDTGANTIAMSSSTARQLGLDLSRGRVGLAQTASGVARMTSLVLDEVSVGPITLFNIEAGVVDGSHPPQPLLGASFLEHLEMRREGQRMELIRR